MRGSSGRGDEGAGRTVRGPAFHGRSSATPCDTRRPYARAGPPAPVRLADGRVRRCPDGASARAPHPAARLLALRRAAGSPRAEIAALLWPEQEDRLAFANLRKTLFRLQSLPWAAAIELQGAALRLEAATDVADFESALREQRTGEALAAYRGEPLAGFDDGASEAWTRWLTSSATACARPGAPRRWRALADPAIEPAEAVALSARLLEADPLDEAALRQHMTRWCATGRPARRAQAYRQFADRLSTRTRPDARRRAARPARRARHGARPPAAGIVRGRAPPGRRRLRRPRHRAAAHRRPARARRMPPAVPDRPRRRRQDAAGAARDAASWRRASPTAPSSSPLEDVDDAGAVRAAAGPRALGVAARRPRRAA